MKKMLIIMPSLFLGGAERSLIGLLETIDYSKVSVDLFLYRHAGELLTNVPIQVNILPEIDQYTHFDTPIVSMIKPREIRFCMRRLQAKLKSMRYRSRKSAWTEQQLIFSSMSSLLPKLEGKYDLAIQFLGVPEVLIHKVDADKKVCWCHTDYDILYPIKRIDQEYYSAVDNIIGVSESCCEKIKKYYPEYSDKVLTIENILPVSFLRINSQKKVPEMEIFENKINLLSIGRFCEAKNFDSIPYIVSKLTDFGLDIRWYLIGFGSDEELIRNNISKWKVNDRVIILGKKANPYPYIRKCDVYVQPSRYEGKCVSVREAQILGKPVIITRFDTASSQLNDGIDGFIISQNLDTLVHELYELLLNKDKLDSAAYTCSQNDYSNEAEIIKIYSLLEIN